MAQEVLTASAKPAPPPATPASQDIWERVSSMDEFQQLLKAKARFIIPACIFFVVYYFLLPISVGFYPEVMGKKIGQLNLAYLFALSQFFVAWIIAGLYVKAARGFDERSAAVLSKLDAKGGK